MATITEDVTEGIGSVISGVGEQSNAALDAVRKFVDSVNAAIPELGADDLRAQIIDSAFSMTRQVVDASNRFAVGVVDSTGKTIQSLVPVGASEQA